MVVELDCESLVIPEGTVNVLVAIVSPFNQVVQLIAKSRTAFGSFVKKVLDISDPSTLYRNNIGAVCRGNKRPDTLNYNNSINGRRSSP